MQLHLSTVQDVLESMKEIAKPFLSETQFVSTNDVLMAFMWMLQCEIREQRSRPVVTVEDLGIRHTTVSMTLEFLTNGLDLIPDSYFGNGFGSALPSSEDLDLDGNETLLEVFAQLCLLVRRHVTAFRKEPRVVAQYVLSCYHAVNSGNCSVSFEGYRGGLTNLMKTSVLENDFGQGPPGMAFFPMGFPLIGSIGTAGPGPGRGEDAMVHVQLTGQQRSRIKDSQIAKQFAPGMKQLYTDITEDELQSLLQS